MFDLLVTDIIFLLSRWNKLIQKPCEIGDPRGLRLIKAILRPLMLRRTKETKDKVGRLIHLRVIPTLSLSIYTKRCLLSILMFGVCEFRPILVLPPTDIQTIECEQSDAEHDFYNALWRRSKVSYFNTNCGQLSYKLRMYFCTAYRFVITWHFQHSIKGGS